MADISRRKFIQLTVLGAATAAAGCGPYRDVDDELRGQYGGTARKIKPYVNQPAGLQDGVPQWFATTCRMCPAGCGLTVRTIGGRAVKVEGNPNHPVNLGKTCARGQASVQHLYSPDRVRYPARRVDGKLSRLSWDDAMTALVSRLSTSKGRVAIVADAETLGLSRTSTALLARLASAAQAKLCYYSLVDDAPWRAASAHIHGRASIPYYTIDRAAYLLAFSANFLEAWPSPVLYGRLFGDFRASGGRFAYVGPRLSMTAAKADLWLPCRPGTESAVALAIQGRLPVDEAAQITGLSAQQIDAVTAEFKAAGRGAIALAGDGLLGDPKALDAVEALNAGSDLVSVDPPPDRPGSVPIAEIAADIDHGAIDTVLVFGQCDLARTRPGMASTLAKASFVASITPIVNDTVDLAQLLLPASSFFEEWGDTSPIVAAPSATNNNGGTGLSSLCQPVVDTRYIPSSTTSTDPWMLPRPTNEIVLDLLRRLGQPNVPADGRAALQSTLPTGVNLDTVMGEDGYVRAKRNSEPHPNPLLGKEREPELPPTSPPGSLSLILYPHIYHGDGRHASLPWMKEIPDPMSMAVWNNWLEINAAVAHSMGIRTGDIVRVQSSTGSVDLPALPTQAIHPEAVACPIDGGTANPLTVVAPNVAGPTPVTLTKVRNARPGYDAAENTLVILEDRPGGQEPEAVKNLIHTTARERGRVQ